MRIVLLRHGKPNVPKIGKLRASEISRWIESYNGSGLMPNQSPSRAAVEVAKSCNCIVCSDLPRSIESAQALGLNEIDVVEPVFREIGLPYGTFPSPRLSPNTWAVIFRLLWFFGYSENGESIRRAKCRAAKGARYLAEIAENTGSVLLVGHGFANRFIAKQLLKNGWRGPSNPGRSYWEYGIYEFAT